MTRKFFVVFLIFFFEFFGPSNCLNLLMNGGGQALSYDGRSPKFISVTSSCGSNAFLLQSFTLEVWVNIQGPKWALPITADVADPQEKSVGGMSLVGLGWEQGFELEFDILSQQLGFQLQGSNLPNECYDLTSSLPPGALFNVWTHIAISFDGLNTGLKSMYINGTLHTSANCTGGVVTVLRNSLYIGGRFAPQNVIDSSFLGQLDEVRLWNYARNASEIAYYMSRSLIPLLASNPNIAHKLVTYLPFDDPDEASHFQDMAHFDYTALNGVLGTGSTESSPIRIPSNVPLYGGEYVFETRVGDSKPLQFSSINGLNMIQSDPVIVIQSVSDTNLLNNIRVSSVNGSPLSMLTPLNTPLYISAVSAMDMTFNYTLNNLPGDIYSVRIIVRANRAPISGGPGASLYCDGVNDFAVANNFTWDILPPNGAGPVTVMFWAKTLQKDVGASVLFSVGNSELVGAWCPNSPAGSGTRCYGRFHGHIPWEDSVLGWHYGWVEGLKGAVQVPDNPNLSSWTHFALVSDGYLAGKAGTGVQSIYANGIKIGSVLSDGPIGNFTLKGLLMCDWRYWGPLPHKGMIDEFRIYNRVLSQSEIQSLMHISFSDPNAQNYLSDPSLTVAYTFDEPDPLASYAKDVSGHGADLLFGACNSVETMTGAHNGIPHCDGGVKVPMQDPTAFPTRVFQLTSDLPLGGVSLLQVAPPAINNSRLIGSSDVYTSIALSTVMATSTLPNSFMISLNGTDPDSDPLSAIITRLPDKGQLFGLKFLANASVGLEQTQASLYPLIITGSNSNNVIVGSSLYAGIIPALFTYSNSDGGNPFTSFDYKLTDGILTSNVATVTISIPCSLGSYLDNNNKHCIPCPPGSFQSNPISFASSCSPCPINTAQPNFGQSSCNFCSVNAIVNGTNITVANFVHQKFQNSQGSSTCQDCQSADYPSDSICPTPTDLNTSSITALNVVTSLVLALIFIVLSIFVWFRDQRVVYSASFSLMVMMLMGLLSTTVSVFIIIRPINTDTIGDSNVLSFCMWRHILFHLGCSALLMALILRAYRLDTIFNSVSLLKKSISSIKFVIPFFFALGYDSVLFIIWSNTYPYSISQPSASILAQCKSDGFILFSCLLFIPKLIYIALLIFISYRIKNIPARLNESSNQFVLCGYLFLAGLVCFLLILTNPTARGSKLIICSLIIISVVFTLFILFSSKLYYLAVSKNPDFIMNGSRASFVTPTLKSGAGPSEIRLNKEIKSSTSISELESNILQKMEEYDKIEFNLSKQLKRVEELQKTLNEAQSTLSTMEMERQYRYHIMNKPAPILQRPEKALINASTMNRRASVQTSLPNPHERTDRSPSIRNSMVPISLGDVNIHDLETLSNKSEKESKIVINEVAPAPVQEEIAPGPGHCVGPRGGSVPSVPSASASPEGTPKPRINKVRIHVQE